jgi:hypothetical protein
MVFLTTQSENHAKEIALCLNSRCWTGFFGILLSHYAHRTPAPNPTASPGWCSGNSVRTPSHKSDLDRSGDLVTRVVSGTP